ncbi:Plasma membrane t-SNARE, secretory vesicle fusion [Borealophlyctis nickersoniae]|nr:Plasma membrane t-SNARE, secretory vesicle fusion [Borealophlyctis nickersoniae]
MARDRWADVRQEQQGGNQSSYSQYGQSQYGQSQYGGQSAAYPPAQTYSSNGGGNGGGRYSPSQSSSQYRPNNGGDIEMGQRNGSGGLDGFLQQTESIQRNITQISRNTADIQALHQRALVETNQQQLSFLTQQVDSITEENNALVQSTRRQIKQLASLRSTNAGDARVRQTQQKALAKKLMQAAQEYQGVQQNAKSAYRNQMARQYAIARPTASQQEIDNAIDSASGPVFQQEIMTSRIGEQRRALEAVRTRHEELQRIEQSITELFNLFQEMQELLDSQQVMIDHIEDHVEQADEAVASGSQQMTKAVSHARSARRTKIIIFVIILIVLIVLAAVIYFAVVKPRQNPSP